MAFVRWRGNCAQLLTTVYEQGRSRQLLLANLHGGFATSPSLWAAVAERFPSVTVDWAAVDRALAVGPVSASPPTAEQLTWAAVAHHLQKWALETNDGYPEEREALRRAADVLTGWQSRR
ncbi:MAG: hypothetical protein M0Z36_01670 [Thermaerobacter sp.]|nr:hypothetical protein [Thermaerobacter sp.]